MLLAELLISATFHTLPVAADMAMTEHVLREPYMRETHIQDRNLRLAANAGIAAGSTWLDQKLHKKGKHKLKWVFRIAHLAIGAYAVQHNWREYEKAQHQRLARR